MRVFIAINFDETMSDELMHTITLLKKYLIKGNETRRENLHLTLAFLGEVARSRMEELTNAMDNVMFPPFYIELLGIRQFKVRGEALYYREVDYPEDLLVMRQQLADELKLANFSIDETEFKPHITLARRCVIKEESNANQQLIERLSLRRMNVSEISLMKSEQINGKLTYTKLYTVKARMAFL